MSAFGGGGRAPYPPVQNGKEKRPGLLTKADKNRLDLLLYGANGELLIGPNAGPDDFLWRDPTGRIHLRSNFETMVEGRGALHLAANAVYNHAGTQWLRMDTTKTAFLLVLRDNPTPQLEFYSVAAGANPIAWVGPVNLTPALVTKLGALVDIRALADPFKLTGTTFSMDILTPLALFAGDLGLSFSAPLIQGGGGDLQVRAATAAVSGYLSAADKATLDTRTPNATASSLVQRDAAGLFFGFGWNNINAAGGAAPAYATNWSNLGGYQAVQYRVTADDAVELRGNMNKSIALVAGETAFTLGSGFRPPGQVSFPVANFTGTTPVNGSIVITTGGAVQVYCTDRGHISLGGVRFYLD